MLIIGWLWVRSHRKQHSRVWIPVVDHTSLDNAQVDDTMLQHQNCLIIAEDHGILDEEWIISKHSSLYSLTTGMLNSNAYVATYNVAWVLGGCWPETLSWLHGLCKLVMIPRQVSQYHMSISWKRVHTFSDKAQWMKEECIPAPPTVGMSK